MCATEWPPEAGEAIEHAVNYYNQGYTAGWHAAEAELRKHLGLSLPKIPQHRPSGHADCSNCQAPRLMCVVRNGCCLECNHGGER